MATSRAMRPFSMPVRSSNSSVLKWPDAAEVLAAARRWAAAQRDSPLRPMRIGVFGSYARGNAGVGSDLDLVAVVNETGEPFERRASKWPLETLPVPAEILVYTDAEWRALVRGDSRFGRMLRDDVLWLT
ncbi:MAG: nucleotidyltransferase domain-containing protein [Gemmatimonadales bacterium]